MGSKTQDMLRRAKFEYTLPTLNDQFTATKRIEGRTERTVRWYKSQLMVFAGVEHLLPVYGQANSYRYLGDEVLTGNPENLSPKRLHERAWALVEPCFRPKQAAAAERCQQLAGEDSPLAADDLKRVVPAAYFGRVDTLYVTADCQPWGRFDPDTGRLEPHTKALPGDEDLPEPAVAQTFINSGTVYVAEAEQVPGHAPVASILHY